MKEEVSAINAITNYIESSSDTFFIRVINLEKQYFRIPVSSDMFIYEVKQAITATRGYEADSQRLIYAGIGLEDNLTVCWYRIQSESEIYLILRDEKKYNKDPT